MVEWFDWSVYGFFAPYFAAAFFPQADETARLLSAFAVFAVGFFVRPLGGAVLGSYADRHGRRAGMTLTILLMAVASLVMALLPTWHAIGVAAPLLLVLARCVQGFSAGGEFGTSSAFLVENAERGGRARAGSWQQVSVGAGTLAASALAAAMFATMTPEALTSWGWRVAFGLGAVFGLVGLYLRRRVPRRTPSPRLAHPDASSAGRSRPSSGRTQPPPSASSPSSPPARGSSSSGSSTCPRSRSCTSASRWRSVSRPRWSRWPSSPSCSRCPAR